MEQKEPRYNEGYVILLQFIHLTNPNQFNILILNTLTHYPLLCPVPKRGYRTFQKGKLKVYIIDHLSLISQLP